MPVCTRAVYKSVKHFAEVYDLPIRTAYKYVNEDDFPKIRMGKLIRVNMAEVDNWIKQRYGDDTNEKIENKRQRTV